MNPSPWQRFFALITRPFRRPPPVVLAAQPPTAQQRLKEAAELVAVLGIQTDPSVALIPGFQEARDRALAEFTLAVDAYVTEPRDGTPIHALAQQARFRPLLDQPPFRRLEASNTRRLL